MPYNTAEVKITYMNARYWLALGVLGAAPIAVAHHSFAPHFDADKTVVIDGTVVEFEARNPHAYLHLEVMENGKPQTWICESHGVTMLERNGLPRSVLAKGAKLRVEGAAARRDPHGCFFRAVQLPDGTRISADGPPRATTQNAAAGAGAEPVAAPEVSAGANPAAEQLFGVWLLSGRRGSGGGGGGPMSDFFTAAGAKASAGYDPFKDDPVMRCDTIGIRRVWGAPGTPLEIARNGAEQIKIRYEWMDAVRTIHLNMTAPPPGFDADSQGYSIGRFDGDALVIDTVYARAGIISQYQELEGGKQIGLLHSPAMKTSERLWVDRDTGMLNVTIETADPLYYTKPFPSTTITYARSDLRVEPFGCTPRSIELAAPQQ